MSFHEDITKFALLAEERKVHINNEELTKQSIVIPFLQLLGYDVFNPLEVKPEYVADFGKKKGEKVDYAVFKNNNPIMFIEAKNINEKLENHDAQLSRYFNSTPEVRLGILTNGISYKFFTDLNENNIMDNLPFYEFDLENLKDSDIEVLQKFRKDFFEVENMISFAEELVYMSNLQKNLKELFRNPSDDFVRFLIKDFSDTRITINVIDRFRPVVKKAISMTLLDIVSQGILKGGDEVEESIKETQDEAKELEGTQKDIEGKRKIITTEEELIIYDNIKNMLLQANKDISDVNYKDTTGYFGIFIRTVNRWFIRISLDYSIKYVVTKLPIDRVKQIVPNVFTVEDAPKGIGVSRVIIDSYEDIKQLQELIITCFEEVDN